MSTYNFSFRRGDTYTGCEFVLNQVSYVAELPVTGLTGIIYKVISTGIYYKWVVSEFVVTTDTNPIDLTGAQIRFEIKKTEFDLPVLVMTELSGLSITNAINGIFEIDSQIINIPIDNYIHEIIVTLATGVVKTYIEGSVEVF